MTLNLKNFIKKISTISHAIFFGSVLAYLILLILGTLNLISIQSGLILGILVSWLFSFSTIYVLNNSNSEGD